MWDDDVVASGQVSWSPDPGWVEFGPQGRSGSRLWLAQGAGASWVVKRLSRPVPGDPAARSDPHHFGYWRREADVALDDVLHQTSGLRAPEVLRVDEDDEGVVVWQAPVDQVDLTGPFRAQALGRFAKCTVGERPWSSRQVLAQRLRFTEHNGGWHTLERTTIADVADRLWQRRSHHLASLDGLPQVPSHGDATPANLRGRRDDDVIAVDWGAFGLAPLGADVGYLALSEREDFDVLVDAYAEGARCDVVSAELGRKSPNTPYRSRPARRAPSSERAVIRHSSSAGHALHKPAARSEVAKESNSPSRPLPQATTRGGAKRLRGTNRACMLDSTKPPEMEVRVLD